MGNSIKNLEEERNNIKEVVFNRISELSRKASHKPYSLKRVLSFFK